jgi:NIMA (never in mitosis gene a)-related kinase
MNDYEKIKVIGQGAFGKVYLVRKKSDNSLVVIKQIPIQEMQTEERQAALNEVDVLKLLRHPNIIAYHANFLSEQSLMIVMEYAPGGTLFEYIQHRNGRLMDEEHILQIFAQIVSALHHVHSLKILHRDLKTQNIMLSRKRNVIKVGDFGISKVLSSKITSAHTIVGTPCYISPEICEGKRYNKKSDIWALGCLLYELTTLHKAFEAMNLPALVMKIMQGSVEPIDKRYSKGLQLLINKLLSLKPSDRPSIEQIMAEPILANSIVNLFTDIGRLPCHKPHSSMSGSGSGSGGRKRSLIIGKAQRQRSFFEDYWAEDEETLLQGPRPVIYVWGSGITFPMVVPQPANSPILQLSMGRTRRLGVTEDGKVAKWDTTSGVFGSSTFSTMGTARKAKVPEPPTLTVQTLDGFSGVTIKKIACGDLFTVCLTDRGILMTFGSGSSGCLGHGNNDDVAQPKIIESMIGYEAMDIACGAYHALALMSEKLVFAWGKSDNGQLGLGSTESTTKPLSLKLPEEFKAKSIFCGPDCSAILGEDGELLVCGSNRSCKLAVRADNQKQEGSSSAITPPRRTQSSPSPEVNILPGLKDFDSFSKRELPSDQELLSTGGVVPAKPKPVATLLSSRRMSSSIVSSLSQSKSGSTQTKNNGTQSTPSPVAPVDAILSLTNVTKEFPLEDNDTIVTMGLGPTHSVFATARGRCYSCGANSYGQLGYEGDGGGSPKCVEAIVYENITKVSCGDAFTVATSGDGQVYTWGKNQRGRLGREAEEPYHEPKPVIFDPIAVLGLCSNHGLTMLVTRRQAS